MRILCQLWAVMAFLSLAINPVSAEERPGSMGSRYVQGGVTFDHQPGATGESHQTYVAAPGGTTLGWTILGGVLIASHASIEGEFSSTGMMRAREPSRYGMTFNEERRDRFLGVNLRFHVPANTGLHLEPVVGFAFVQHQRWSQTEYSQFGPTPQPVIVSPRVRSDLPARIGVTGGVDARLGGEHVAIVPSFRLRVAGVDDTIRSNYPGGFSRWTVSGGVAARVDF